MSVLVDSDILIEVSRGKNASILSKWNALSESDQAILYSPVSAAELCGGLPASRAHPAPKPVPGRLHACAIDSEVGRGAGDYIRQYGKSHAVELGDALIAAGAVTNGALLWTCNRKHYPMKDLKFF